ncbi:hypothetical protein C8F01DRAFT_1235621 [Mycena amicta]|nr:hypothetical protein C8F01DRAFT_1235621 [Mycena amicta]
MLLSSTPRKRRKSYLQGQTSARIKPTFESRPSSCNRFASTALSPSETSNKLPQDLSASACGDRDGRGGRVGRLEIWSGLPRHLQERHNGHPSRARTGTGGRWTRDGERRRCAVLYTPHDGREDDGWTGFRVTWRLERSERTGTQHWPWKAPSRHIRLPHLRRTGAGNGNDPSAIFFCLLRGLRRDAPRKRDASTTDMTCDTRSTVNGCAYGFTTKEGPFEVTSARVQTRFLFPS